MKSILQSARNFLPVGFFFCAGVVLFTVFRLVLLALNIGRFERIDPSTMGRMFSAGLHLDFVMMCHFTIPAIVFTAFRPSVRTGLTRRYLAATLAAIFGACVAELHFFKEFDVRYNHLALDYLAYPREVLGYFLGEYKLAIFLLTIGIVCAYRLGIRHFDRRCADLLRAESHSITRIVIMTILLAAGVFGARGSLTHHPVSISAVYFSDHHVANQIGANGLFTLRYALVNALTHDVRLTREYRLAALDKTGAAGNPFLKNVGSERPRKDYNVVMVLMESFKAEWSKTYGGKYDAAPHFDRLAKDGVLFKNLFATGERTIRGMEAVAAGFPPLPGRAVVKKSRAQQNFLTLAAQLKNRGYETFFFYGGAAQFDNMTAFMRSNGVTNVIEESAFDQFVHKTSWGVSDEDVFNRGIADLGKITGRPFFAFFLTISMHAPWTYPDGRVEAFPSDIPYADKMSAMRYSDWAIGDFVDKFRALPQFSDTIFVFVADHGIHMRGFDLANVAAYKIPALIYAPGILPAREIDGICSQIDIPPTVLGILGGIYQDGFPGIDLLNDPPPNRAIMIYYDNLVYLEGDRALILPPRADAVIKGYRDVPGVFDNGLFDLDLRSTSENARKRKLLEKLTAIVLPAYETYRNGTYSPRIK